MNVKVGRIGPSKQVSLSGDGGMLADPATFPDQTLPGNDLRIPRSALDADLEYRVPQPTTEYARDTLDVFLRVKGQTATTTLEDKLPLGPIADRTWPKELYIPLNHLVELPTPEAPTQYELVYVMWANGVNPGDTAVTEFHIDKTKPYQVKDPQSDFSPDGVTFPADLPQTQEIDDEYISNHPTGIDITLTLAQFNAEATDKVDIYWGDISDPSYFSTPVMSDVPVRPDGKITMPIDIFENSQEGVNTLRFIMTDLAGNVSRPSKAVQRTVRRLPPPVSVPPVVPLADGTDGDTLINLADCSQGVTVEIEVPKPSAYNDIIQATWQGRDLPPVRVEDKTLLVFPVDYTTIIKPAYGATDGEVDTTVIYVMLRGSGDVVARNQTTIQVDISYPGPENPREPDEVNPALNLPRLVSSQGEDNVLDDNDYDQDAHIFIQLWDSPPTESGQSITVWYDDVPLTPTYFLAPGEEGTEIPAATVPWDVIARKPNEVIKIKYQLSVVLGNNPVWSEDEDVDVDITKIDLPAPEVQGTINNAIACRTLNFVPPTDGTSRRNLKVVIPFSSSLIDTRVVTLKWGGFSDENATIPIAGTEVTKTHTITGTVPPEGIEMEIGDYFVNFKPVTDGFGKLTYTITDVVPESDPAIHFVFLKDNNDDFCEIANPIP
ncbi:hypothetical protein BK653_01405 [Pseudomonas brassicacearum]|uniref:hypothetical protein n=1 Tax=Pseudomonas brassicacearum TaxID=930166 RepID=UPI000F4A14A6|nr:hypothetical protein [Pseudomonas brassicacearum]ROM70576.1 hypothetical protein BK653_01405 [Pseudomonas brassicacearum]